MNEPHLGKPFERDAEPTDACPLRRTIASYIERHSIQGDVRRVLTALAGPPLTGLAFARIVADTQATEVSTMRVAILDAILYAMEAALADHELTDTERRTLYELQRTAGLVEGEVLTRRPERVAALLETEMRRLLADRSIAPEEALHQVALQEIFGLSYDEYRALTRPAVEALVNECISEITADGIVTPEERARLEDKIRALDTAYTFTPEERARLADAGLVIKR
jgi:tellurite resistance protein